MKRNNKHIFTILVVMLLVFFILLINVFYIAIFKIHFNSKTNIEEYSTNVGLYTDVLVAKRGTIYDSKKNILAEDVVTYKIIANLDKKRFNINGDPAHVADPLKTAKELATILNEDEETLYNYLNQDNVIQVELGIAGKNLSWQIKEEIEKLNLPGISFLKMISRRYPEGDFASYMVGYALYNEPTQTIVGEMGIESIFDDSLTGINGYRKYQASKGSNIMIPGTDVEILEDYHGNDIYLTINKDIQILLEKTLEDATQQIKPDKIWAALMEVKTGKILAMSSKPSFNPENPEIENYINLNTRYIFEPGSTFKSFTYAAAIDANVYPNEMFDSSIFYFDVVDGVVKRSKTKTSYGEIRNAGGVNYGNISFDAGFAYSSNVGIAELLTNHLKPAVLKEYIEKFGFLKEVGFDGYSEEQGSIQFDHPIEHFNVGFGQGISVSTIQMLQAYSAFFNEGKMVKPYIVEQIKNPITNEVSYLAQTEIAGEPISKNTALKMMDLLEYVVYKYDGTGFYYRQSEFYTMAKTGTAQIFEDGTYKDNNNLASVLIAFPTEEPQFLLFYGFEAPYNPPMHGKSGPINNFVYQIGLEYGLIKKDVNNTDEPDFLIEIESSIMPNLINQSVKFGLDKLVNSQVEVVLLGSGNQIIEQYPHQKTEIYTNQKVFLKTNQSEITMPNMLGWSRKDVTAFWSLSQLPITMDGYGWVINQNIPAGTILHQDSEIIVKFQ